MGRKRRSIHNPKFAKRLKYAALRKESSPVMEESNEIELQQESNDEEVVPEVLLFNEPDPDPEPVKIEVKEKPMRKPRKQTTRKRTTRKKATKKEVT
tara:strand:- start:342 stop:632 length:291 start_codon:yes stop_codon:yes gene_type:complete